MLALSSVSLLRLLAFVSVIFFGLADFVCFVIVVARSTHVLPSLLTAPAGLADWRAAQECHIDLRKMALFAGVVLVHTEAVGLDTSKRLVHCKDGRPPIPYDVLSIDIGSTPKFVQARVR